MLLRGKFTLRRGWRRWTILTFPSVFLFGLKTIRGDLARLTTLITLMVLTILGFGNGVELVTVFGAPRITILLVTLTPMWLWFRPRWSVAGSVLSTLIRSVLSRLIRGNN